MESEPRFNNIQVLQEELRLRGFKMKQDEVKEVYAAFCDMIRDFAKNGYELNLPTVGKFYIKIHPAREQPNNIDGGVNILPERKRLKFKPSQKLTDLINRDMRG